MKLLILSIMLCLGVLFGSGCISNPLKQVQQTVQVESHGAKQVVSAKVPTAPTVKSVVESESHILIALGIIGILGGAALIYFGQLTLGIEFIVGGLLVPIIGIIIAKYYLWIIVGVIVGLVVTHWTVVKPYFEDAETAGKGLWNDLMNLIQKPAAPVTGSGQITAHVSGSGASNLSGSVAK